MGFRLIYALHVVLSLASIFFALETVRNILQLYQNTRNKLSLPSNLLHQSRGNVEMKTNNTMEPFKSLQRRSLHKDSRSPSKKDTKKPKCHKFDPLSGQCPDFKKASHTIKIKDDNISKPKSSEDVNTISGIESFVPINPPEIPKDGEDWKPKSAPRLRIQTVSGYIDSLAEFGGNPDMENIRDFTKPDAFLIPNKHGNSIIIDNYISEFFKNLWSDWFLGGRIFGERKPVLNHIVNVFAWTCLEIRQMVKSKRTEDFAHLQTRIQCVFDNYYEYSKKLVIVDCPLVFSENIIVPARIARKHLVHKNENFYDETNDKYEGETLVLLIEGETKLSYMSHQPKDILNIVRDKNPRLPSVRKLSKKEISLSDLVENRIVKPNKPGSFHSGPRYAATSEIIIYSQTYGYLTSMQIFRANEREDISIWSAPGAFNYSFTLPENANYLKEYNREIQKTEKWTDWIELYQHSDTVREHCIKSYAQACVEMQNMVGAVCSDNLLEFYEQIFARQPSRWNSRRVEFHCPLKFKKTGRAIVIKTVKKSQPRNYDGVGTSRTKFPNEEFMVFLEDHLMDVVLLEEGQKNMKVLRYFWEHNRVRDPHQAKNKSVEKTESDVDAFYDNMRSEPDNSEKYEMPPDDGSDLWAFTFKCRG